jgi:predicted anti-sigma-YlaC factor YlaD
MPAGNWTQFRARSSNEETPRVKAIRSLLSVCLGFALFFGIVRGMTVVVGSGPDTSGAYINAPVVNYLVESVSWTVGAALIAGYITARIAGSREFPHAAALGLLMVIASFVSMRQEGISQPGWYQTTVAGCGPIAAMIGAAIRVLGKRQRPIHRA